MTAARTAERILTLVRLRARRLALWTVHVWSVGQASPDQGPAIGPDEVARLLSPDAARAAEGAFYAERAAELSAPLAAAAEDLRRDAGWTAICRTFALDAVEADFLALLVAVDLDPGLTRVVAFLHDDARLTDPTPWLAARLAGAQPSPANGANLRRWLLASPAEGASPDRLMSAWRADPAVTAAVVNGVWRDPDIAEGASVTTPQAAGALP
jgi:hypothetical protein